MDEFGEQRRAVVVFVFVNGVGEGVFVVGGVAEQAGVQKVHLRVEVEGVVLYRRAGEAEAVVGLDEAHRFVALRLGVFDVLAFVEDGVVEGDVLQGFDVAHQGAVGGEDDVVCGEVGGVGIALAPGQGIEAQVGCEFFNFCLPVVDE